ncbi:hypothetical protein B0H14DRAFT_3428843 [Mycena olivaceomarginata]|nr:hypothetical protein B0H14DRAFT_3428843 [Mycena olivaceomarginata]
MSPRLVLPITATRSPPHFHRNWNLRRVRVIHFPASTWRARGCQSPLQRTFSAFGAAQPQQRGPLVEYPARSRSIRAGGLSAPRCPFSLYIAVPAHHPRSGNALDVGTLPRGTRRLLSWCPRTPAILRLRPVRAVGVPGLPGSARAVAALIGWSEEAQDADAGGEDGRGDGIPSRPPPVLASLLNAGDGSRPHLSPSAQRDPISRPQPHRHHRLPPILKA